VGAADPGAETPLALEEASAVASVLRAGAVVLEGGVLPPGVSREEAVETALRRIHGLVVTGVPLALRIGGRVGDLLGFEEAGWALESLPRLSLWFDPARALERAGAGAGPDVPAWAERYAGRMAGIHLERLPAEDGTDWKSLVQSLPTRVPWVLDPPAAVSERDLQRAVGYLRSLGG
jgi:hypothetical protein